MSGPLRIAVVCESYDPAGGGSERSTRQTVDELVARGHNVTVVAGACRADVASAVGDAGVALVARGDTRLTTGRRLREFAHFASAQLSAGTFDTSLSVTTAVSAAVAQPRGGTVMETQRRNVARRPSAAARAGKRLALAFNAKQRALVELERRTFADPSVRRVVAISGYVAAQLAEHHDVSGERVAVVPNGAVSPAAGVAGGPAGWARLRDEERLRLRLAPNDVAFLFAALNPGLKGWPTLRAALARRAEAAAAANTAGGPRVVALLAGDFGDRDRRALASAGLAGTTRVLGRRDDLASAYAAADAVVLPTWYDPCSKTVLEGLMVGRPAVTTRYNGAADWLTPAQGPPRGVVLNDSGDVEALAGALTRVADPAFRSAAAAACAGLDQTLGMGRHVDGLEAVLREAAGRMTDGQIP